MSTLHAIKVPEPTLLPWQQQIRAIFEIGDVLNFTMVHGSETYIGKDKKPHPCTKEHWIQFDGTDEDVLYNKLLSYEQDGFNIYVCAAVFDFAKIQAALAADGRKRVKENFADVPVVRALGIECDDDGEASYAKVREAVAGGLVPAPTLVIQSSTPKPDSGGIPKYHFWWKVEGFTLPQRRAVSESLQQAFGGDASTADDVRVLRLAGFINNKPEKYPHKPMATIVEQNGGGYTFEQFNLPVIVEAEQAERPKASSFIIEGTTKQLEENASLAGYDLGKRSAWQVTGFMFEPDECPNADSHSDGNRGGFAIRVMASGARDASCFHGHCREDNPDEGKTLVNWKWFKDYLDDLAGDPLDWSNSWMVVAPDAKAEKPAAKIDEPAAPTSVQASAPVQADAEPAQWSEPKLFEPLLSPVPPCRLDYLPASFRAYAQDVSERMSVPLDYVVICMMCSFAAVIGRRAFVYPKANDMSWKEALNLLGAVVAPSGSKKSPAWRHFVNPLIQIEAGWREAHDQQMEDYRRQMDAYKQAKKDAKKDGVLPPPPPDEPKPRRRIVFNDATPEKMHAMMETNPEGLYSFQDEIGGWLAMMDKKGREAERRMFLAAANGDEWFTLDRIERGEVGAWMCSSYFGGMQPFVCQALVNDPRNVGDGTTARFGLLSYPDNTVFTPRIDRNENDAAKIQYSEILREFAPLTVRSITLKFTADAQPMFNDWQNAHDERVLSLPDTVTRSHLSKYNGLVPRLAALYQLADLAAVIVNTEGVSTGIPGLVLIDAEHLVRAIAFVTEYLEPHMNRVYGCIKSPWQLAEASLAERVKAGDLRAPFTAREITRKHWTHLKDSEAVSFAIETLIEYGWLRQVFTPAGQNGRPTIRYEVNPAAVDRRRSAAPAPTGKAAVVVAKARGKAPRPDKRVYKAATIIGNLSGKRKKPTRRKAVSAIALCHGRSGKRKTRKVLKATIK